MSLETSSRRRPLDYKRLKLRGLTAGYMLNCYFTLDITRGTLRRISDERRHTSYVAFLSLLALKGLCYLQQISFLSSKARAFLNS